ncbi:hypothetical protein TNCV_1936571 [Trichonephila clavipes]|nr:hypothetical protein TNCV_1936571 [Trichonephila clavipes]
MRKIRSTLYTNPSILKTNLRKRSRCPMIKPIPKLLYIAYGTAKDHPLDYKWYPESSHDIKIYKSSQNDYYINVPNITFPSFVDNHILPYPVRTRLKFHGSFANEEFLRNEAGFLYI